MRPPSASDALSAAAARFAADLAAVVGRPLGERERVALAVSGGPDSMAMLLLAHAALPGRVAVATVDHRLRAAAADEAAMVAGYCAAIGVPHTTLVPSEPIAGTSIQARARAARYALLGEWAAGIDVRIIATAHHADDQAETFLMRANRGSGPGGLSGIRARWTWDHHRWHGGYPRGGVVGVADVTSVTVVRPLLRWRRSELREIVKAAGAPFVTDPTNDDARYDRTRMRALLAAHPELDAPLLARSAEACAESDAALTAMLDLLWRERSREIDASECALDMARLPRELRRRLTRAAIGYVRSVQGIAEGQWADGTNIEPLLDALEAGATATQAGVIGSVDGDVWRFAAAPPRRAL